MPQNPWPGTITIRERLACRGMKRALFVAALAQTGIGVRLACRLQVVEPACVRIEHPANLVVQRLLREDHRDALPARREKSARILDQLANPRLAMHVVDDGPRAP